MDILAWFNDWYGWVAMYIFGFFPSWTLAMRRRTHWIISQNHEVVAKWKGSDAPFETFFLGLAWPIYMTILISNYFFSNYSNSKLVNGKPPKKLVAEALDKKAEHLLREDK